MKDHWLVIGIFACCVGGAYILWLVDTQSGSPEPRVALTSHPFEAVANGADRNKNVGHPPAAPETSVKAPSLSIPELVARVKHAVVQVVAYDEDEHRHLGTGWFADDGNIVTNFHVIAGADLGRVYAKTASGRLLPIEHLSYWSFDHDLTGFMTNPEEWRRENLLPSLHLAEPGTAREGERVLVIGNPEGLYGTVSDGIISAIREAGDIIQITAPISPGSSGSPVLNEAGEVIGVATYSGKKGQNLNFAISAKAVLDVMYKSFLENTQSDERQDSLPSKEADLHKAELLLNKAYEVLLDLLNPQQRGLFEEDQELWLLSCTTNTKPKTAGFYKMTQRRANELLKLCDKYNQ